MPMLWRVKCTHRPTGAQFEPLWPSQVIAAVAAMLWQFGAIRILLCEVPVCPLASSHESCRGDGEAA